MLPAPPTCTRAASTPSPPSISAEVRRACRYIRIETRAPIPFRIRYIMDPNWNSTLPLKALSTTLLPLKAIISVTLICLIITVRRKEVAISRRRTMAALALTATASSSSSRPPARALLRQTASHYPIQYMHSQRLSVERLSVVTDACLRQQRACRGRISVRSVCMKSSAGRSSVRATRRLLIALAKRALR